MDVGTQTSPHACRGFAVQSRERDTLTTLVEQHFNQLTVFDPRVPHGVAAVEGVREPTESRIVLHGWFTSSGPFFQGAVSQRMSAQERMPLLWCMWNVMEIWSLTV